MVVSSRQVLQTCESLFEMRFIAAAAAAAAAFILFGLYATAYTIQEKCVSQDPRRTTATIAAKHIACMYATSFAAVNSNAVAVAGGIWQR
jgi:hypothetical protein